MRYYHVRLSFSFINQQNRRRRPFFNDFLLNAVANSIRAWAHSTSTIHTPHRTKTKEKINFCERKWKWRWTLWCNFLAKKQDRTTSKPTLSSYLIFIFSCGILNWDGFSSWRGLFVFAYDYVIHMQAQTELVTCTLSIVIKTGTSPSSAQLYAPKQHAWHYFSQFFILIVSIVIFTDFYMHLCKNSFTPKSYSDADAAADDDGCHH